MQCYVIVKCLKGALLEMKTDDELLSIYRTISHNYSPMRISRFDTLTGQILLVSEK